MELLVEFLNEYPVGSLVWMKTTRGPDCSWEKPLDPQLCSLMSSSCSSTLLFLSALLAATPSTPAGQLAQSWSWFWS